MDRSDHEFLSRPWRRLAPSKPTSDQTDRLRTLKSATDQEVYEERRKVMRQELSCVFSFSGEHLAERAHFSYSLPTTVTRGLLRSGSRTIWFSCKNRRTHLIGMPETSLRILASPHIGFTVTSFFISNHSVGLNVGC